MDQSNKNVAMSRICSELRTRLTIERFMPVGISSKRSVVGAQDKKKNEMSNGCVLTGLSSSSPGIQPWRFVLVITIGTGEQTRLVGTLFR